MKSRFHCRMRISPGIPDEYSVATKREAAPITDLRVKQYFVPKEILRLGETVFDYKASVRGQTHVRHKEKKLISAEEPKNKKANNSSSPVLVREFLIRDPIFLCVSESLLQKYLGERAKKVIADSLNGADLKSFREIPFMLFQNRMGILIRRCFEEAGYEPHTYLTAPYAQIISSIGFQGTAAFFSTRVFLSSHKEEIPEDLHIFPLIHHGGPLYQDIYLLHNRERYIPRYTARFLELLHSCFQVIDEMSFEDS